ncbi:MAG: hypothetical protein ABR564_00980, partial [Candidatus Dormibacteria bacterium]
TVTHRWAECARLRMLFPGRPRALTPEQHVVAQRHLARCQGCRVLAGRLSAPVKVLQALRPVPVPPRLQTWPIPREAEHEASPAAVDTAEPMEARVGAGRRRGLKLPRRRWLVTTAAAVVVLAGAAAVGVARLGRSSGPARPPSPSHASTAVPVAQPLTVRFGVAPGLQRFTVPCGVNGITVAASGGSGGSGPSAAPGGRGATVTADVPVDPGQLLLIVVGANGPAAAAAGGGGGGGGTGIGLATGNGQPGGDILAVGGGGGGGGNPRGVAGAGGPGGDADAPGAHAVGSMGGAGGTPGLQAAGSPGGAAGAGPAGAGQPGGPGTNRGGLGGGPNGGAGATGHFSGGGGGGGGSRLGAVGGGGGGGGGSTFVEPSATNVTRGLDALASPGLAITHRPSPCPGGRP